MYSHSRERSELQPATASLQTGLLWAISLVFSGCDGKSLGLDATTTADPCYSLCRCQLIEFLTGMQAHVVLDDGLRPIVPYPEHVTMSHFR